MAYMARKRIKGISYYYAEESERVDGEASTKMAEIFRIFAKNN